MRRIAVAALITLVPVPRGARQYAPGSDASVLPVRSDDPPSRPEARREDPGAVRSRPNGLSVANRPHHTMRAVAPNGLQGRVICAEGVVSESLAVLQSGFLT